MRRLAILGVAALTTIGLAGTSCSSSKTTPGTTTTTGGSSSTAGTTGGTDTGSTAGNASTGGSKAAGTGTGGAAPTGTGGAAQGGATGLTGGVATPNNYYTQGALMGYVWTAKDTDGSTIALTAGQLCASGTAIKVPNIDGGTTPDYGNAWGVDVGWNLNQTAAVGDGGAGTSNTADLSGLTSVTVGLSGATGLTLRVQVEVDTAGTPAYYCTSLPAAGGTINLADLKTLCYGTTNNVPFDKTTMKPVNFALQVVTDITKAYPFSFCVTSLTFQ